eukprot:8569790-Lingulodinium_polyedra.AAC.1
MARIAVRMPWREMAWTVVVVGTAWHAHCCWHGTAWHGMARRGVAWHDTARRCVRIALQQKLAHVTTTAGQ